MKKHVDFNTEKRKNVDNDFEKKFFKINDKFCVRKNNGKFAKKD